MAFNGKLKHYACAFVQMAFDGDLSAVSFNKLFGNSQTETRTAGIESTGFVNTVESFKKMIHVFFGNTHTVVLYLNENTVGLGTLG